MSVVYRSLDDFYAARGIWRERADEHDFGMWWRDRRGGVYRLTWLGSRNRPEDAAAPGELYLLALRGSHFGTVELLCLISPTEDYETPNGLPRYVTLDGEVERILDGWGDACGADGSVEWVRDRVRAAIADGSAHEGGVDHGRRDQVSA